MRSRWMFGLALTALLATATAPLEAQCRPADTNAFWLLRLVKKYTYPIDAHWAAVRDSLKIDLPTAKTGVVQITKSVVCKSANTAYQKQAGGQVNTLSGQVYVVQSGNSYVVWDPTFRYAPGSSATYMVFDANWVFKRGFQ